MPSHSPADARFLRAIWSLSTDERTVTVTALARRLDHVPGTVSDRIRKLAERGWVAREPYRGLALTARGHSEALRAVRTLRLLHCALSDLLGMPWPEIPAEAAALEGAASDRLIEQAESQLGSPATDPFGEPIPDRSGSLTDPRDRPLGSPGPASGSNHFTISRVVEHSMPVLERLDTHRLRPGARISLRSRSPLAGSMTLGTSDGDVEIGLPEIRALRVHR